MATGGGRQRRTRTLEANEAAGKGSGSNGRPTLEAEEDRGPTMVARPDGSVEAETAALWPDGPQGEPEELGPGRNALFTPQQMRRLDEWTDEAPLINASPGDGDRGGFPETRAWWRPERWRWHHSSWLYRYLEDWRKVHGQINGQLYNVLYQHQGDMLEAHGFPNGKISVWGSKCFFKDMEDLVVVKELLYGQIPCRRCATT